MALAASPAAASPPPFELAPPPDCVAFVVGLSASPDHHACSVDLGEAATSCTHDDDASLQETYNDTDCLVRVSSVLLADCVHNEGTVSGAPYDATNCGLVIAGTLVLECSSEGGFPGPGQTTRRYSACSAGPVSCSVTMTPDPRYAPPGSVTPTCTPPVPPRRARARSAR
jgi:hypothetical protein